MRRSAFLFSIFLSPLFSFSQWTWLNPLPQGNILWSVSAVDSLHCYCAGEYGTVMKTTDGGTSWSILSTGTTQNFRSVFFIDQENGWAATDSGGIVHTNDGGNSWEWQYNSPAPDCFVRITFTGPEHGCIIGGNPNYGTRRLLMTWDGGISWEEKSTGSQEMLSDVSFPDSLHGWAISSHGEIFRTTDAGMTWSLQQDYGPFVWFSSLCFADSLHGWICENDDGKMYVTSDGGATWTIKTVPDNPSRVLFTDSLNGYICSYGFTGNEHFASIRRSVDGGISWGQKVSLGVNLIGDFSFCEQDKGWFCGSSGAIFKTTDGNGSWSAQTFEFTHEHLFSSSFLENGMLCWAAGISGKILHSADFGQTWAYQESGMNTFLYKIQFADPDNGWACGGYGTVIRTTDGGAHWDRVTIPTTAHCRSLSFVTPERGYVICDTGIILKTTNAGLTWSRSTPWPYIDLLSVFFTDSLTGWIAGFSMSHAVILKTTDGGETWDLNPINKQTVLQDMFFIDSQYGWAVGNYNTYLRTSDGGVTWYYQEYPYATDLLSVWFIDRMRGVISGDDGTLLRTYDGGYSWQKVESGNRVSMMSVFVNDEGTCWSVGGDGCILTYPDILVGTPFNEGHGTRPALTLYPNPAVSSTMISYRLDTPGNVRITVNPVSGASGSMVLDEWQERGEHEFQLKTDNMPPGLYVCTLQHGNRMFSAKLIVMP